MSTIMRRRPGRALLLPASLFLFFFTSCVPALEDMLVAPGDPVRFSAVASGETGSTRTVYSGQTYTVGTGGPVYERVNWVAKDESNGIEGDRIRIASAECRLPESKYADYEVTAVSGTTGRNSTAEISPLRGQGLAWGEGSHDFYAIYPSPGATGADGSLAFTGGNTATLRIPPAQSYSSKMTSETIIKMLPDMNYAYMYAAQTVTDPTASVSLEFKPLFTAFEITVGSDGEDEMGLYSFYMTANQDLNGTFPVSMDAEDETWTLGTVAGGTQRIDVSLGGTETPTMVSRNNALTFTVFAVPQEYLDGVVLHFETSKGHRQLELKDKDDNWVKFYAGKKAVIEGLQIPGTVRINIIEPISNLVFRGHGPASGTFTVDSYSGTPMGQRRDVAWKIEYSTNYDETTQAGDWYETTSADGGANAPWLSITGATLYDGSPETLTATITGESLPGQDKDVIIQDMHRMVLQENVVSASDGQSYDLSMHTIHDEKRDLPVTANCYVVQAPGTYCFPLVYGNAIDGTKVDAKNDLDGINENIHNKEAYWPDDTQGSTHIPSNARFFLKRFINADNEPIDSPFIETDLGITDDTNLDAIALWQDISLPDPEDVSTGEDEIPIVTNVHIRPAPASSKLGKCHYIEFEIEKENIRQGNIVIALRDKSRAASGENPTIIWSWHIWVTDEDLHPQEVEMQAGSVQMMPFSLGWSDIQGAARYARYESRRCYVRITQVDDEEQVLAGGASTIFQVYQQGDLTYHVLPKNTLLTDNTLALAYLGSSPYFQFGRKDPFLGRDYRKGTKNIRFIPYGDYQIEQDDATVNYDATLVNTNASVGINIGLAIQKPYIYYNSDRKIWYGGYDFRTSNVDYTGAYTIGHDNRHGFQNLWDAYCAGRGEDADVRKTVYDPCPPGFSIPRRDAFSGFTYDGGYYGASNSKINGRYDTDRGGYYFYKKRMTGTSVSPEPHPEGGDMFFCQTGLRREGSVARQYTGWAAYWTTARTILSESLTSYNNDVAIHLVVYGSHAVEPKYAHSGDGYFSDSWNVRPTAEEGPWCLPTP